MTKIAMLVMPLIAVCAACAPQTAAPPPQPASALPQVAAVPPPTTVVSEPPPAPGSGPIWDVTRITCGQLLGADDDDRAAASMFYYGYLAASSHIRIIDVSRIDQNVRRVMNVCTRSPGLTIPQAYRIAFSRRPRA